MLLLQALSDVDKAIDVMTSCPLPDMPDILLCSNTAMHTYCPVSNARSYIRRRRPTHNEKGQ